MSANEYEEVSLSRAMMLRDRILVKWERATEEYGKTGLVRPDQYKQAHFTGIVLAVGPKVSTDLKVWFEEDKKEGRETRISFDQWSRFDKFVDPEHGRVAILAEVAQDDCLAIIPTRGEITLAGVHPVGKRVLIQPDVKEWEDKGRFIVPGTKKLEVQQGEIIAVGGEVEDMHPGDIVLFEKYAGAEFDVEGHDYLLLQSRKVVGVMEPRLERMEVNAA
jgi:chaperonin GroES